MRMNSMPRAAVPDIAIAVKWSAASIFRMSRLAM